MMQNRGFHRKDREGKRESTYTASLQRMTDDLLKNQAVLRNKDALGAYDQQCNTGAAQLDVDSVACILG